MSSAITAVLPPVARREPTPIALHGVTLEDDYRWMRDKNSPEVLEHLNFNPLPVIYEINRVLKPGGLLYLALPNQVRLRNRLAMLRGKSALAPIEEFFAQLDRNRNMIVAIHWREYTIAEVRGILERLGFSVSRQVFFDLSDPVKDGFLLTVAKKILYGAVPSFRPNQVTFALKASRPHFDFHFCDANSFMLDPNCTAVSSC